MSAYSIYRGAVVTGGKAENPVVGDGTLILRHGQLFGVITLFHPGKSCHMTFVQHANTEDFADIISGNLEFRQGNYIATRSIDEMLALLGVC